MFRIIDQEILYMVNAIASMGAHNWALWNKRHLLRLTFHETIKKTPCPQYPVFGL